MKKVTFIGLISCLLLSCGEKPVKKPDGLIPKETMVRILYDLALLYAPGSIGTVPDPYGVQTMEFLYQKYQIDSVQFVQSDQYYAALPLEYQELYEMVIKQLDERKEALEQGSVQQKDSMSQKS